MKKALLLSLIIILGGCTVTMAGSRDNFIQSGLSRAAYELECPKDKLEIISLGGGSHAARGCGKKTIYVHTTDSGYVRNSPIDEY